MRHFKNGANDENPSGNRLFGRSNNPVWGINKLSWQAWGGGGRHSNVNDTTYFVNLSMKGESVQNSSKSCQRSLWMSQNLFDGVG